MRIAITGGTGFVGRHLAQALTRAGHEIVQIARGLHRDGSRERLVERASFWPIGLDDPDALSEAFAGCNGVAHCAGINRQLGRQTYQRVHIEGTRNVVEAARRAGVRKVAVLSFLRARPACESGYHESKWAAEEIVRNSGLDYTVLKAGVIYGRGDHMLDHLTHALHTFPLFALVGFRDQSIRPVAVEDVVRVLSASLVDGRLSRKTVAVTGPELMTLGLAVQRVASVVGRRPLMFPAPVALHYGLAWLCERLMKIPLVSMAQVRILSEGITVPLPLAEPLPEDLRPTVCFTPEQIRRGLPPAGPFTLRDCRCCTLSAARC